MYLFRLPLPCGEKSLSHDKGTSCKISGKPELSQNLLDVHKDVEHGLPGIMVTGKLPYCLSLRYLI